MSDVGSLGGFPKGLAETIQLSKAKNSQTGEVPENFRALLNKGSPKIQDGNLSSTLASKSQVLDKLKVPLARGRPEKEILARKFMDSKESDSSDPSTRMVEVQRQNSGQATDIKMNREKASDSTSSTSSSSSSTSERISLDRGDKRGLSYGPRADSVGETTVANNQKSAAGASPPSISNESFQSMDSKIQTEEPNSQSEGVFKSETSSSEDSNGSTALASLGVAATQGEIRAAIESLVRPENTTSMNNVPLPETKSEMDLLEGNAPKTLNNLQESVFKFTNLDAPSSPQATEISEVVSSAKPEQIMESVAKVDGPQIKLQSLPGSEVSQMARVQTAAKKPETLVAGVVASRQLADSESLSSMSEMKAGVLERGESDEVKVEDAGDSEASVSDAANSNPDVRIREWLERLEKGEGGNAEHGASQEHKPGSKDGHKSIADNFVIHPQQTQGGSEAQSNRGSQSARDALGATALGAGVTSRDAAALGDEDSKANLQRIMSQTQMLVKKGGGEVKVDLHPEGLGPVHIRVAIEDGRVNLSLRADSDSTKRLIEKGLPELKTGLAEHKLSVGTLKVEGGHSLGSNLGAENSSNKSPSNGFGDGARDNRDARDQQTKNFWQQFQQNFGSSQQRRDGFYEMPGSKAYGIGKPEPLKPAEGSRSSTKQNGQENRLNIVA